MLPRNVAGAASALALVTASTVSAAHNEASVMRPGRRETVALIDTEWSFRDVSLSCMAVPCRFL
jgi:hypothetical protein